MPSTDNSGLVISTTAEEAKDYFGTRFHVEWIARYSFRLRELDANFT
jgi:hypothetical protein